MRIAIIGGGITGLSSAYYLRKLGLPFENVLIFEASKRFGGWLRTDKHKVADKQVQFEKGPRTLRISTREYKELNSLQLTHELGLSDQIELVANNHPAATNRYIYFNGKVNAVKPKLFGKNVLMNKSGIGYLWKEYRTAPRDASVQDESIHSFISRRFDSSIADNLIDPVFKGICGGDVRELSARAFLNKLYDHERQYGSILRGALSNLKKKPERVAYPDLDIMAGAYLNKSVWRFKDGIQQLSDRLVDNISAQEGVVLNSAEPVRRVHYNQSSKSFVIETQQRQEEVDYVIGAIQAKHMSKILPPEWNELNTLLGQIDSVDMVVVNFYFSKNVLPVQGFGYLVPTNQESAILGCIFDSVFDLPNADSTVLTVMMGGAWFDKYIRSKSEQEIKQLAFDELRRHLGLDQQPDLADLTVLNDAIPQYRVGHLDRLEKIDQNLSKLGVGRRLYLAGYSYEGIGVNDCIFNSRKLVESILENNF